MPVRPSQNDSGDGAEHSFDLQTAQEARKVLAGGSSAAANEPIMPSTGLVTILRQPAVDNNLVSFGCALLFLHYLRSQLGFSMSAIVLAPANSLEGGFFNLTKDHGAFQTFSNILESRFPSRVVCDGVLAGQGRRTLPGRVEAAKNNGQRERRCSAVQPQILGLGDRGG